MRCKTCHYSLANLAEHRCPECGTPFDPNDPSSVLRAGQVAGWRLLWWILLGTTALMVLLVTSMWLLDAMRA